MDLVQAAVIYASTILAKRSTLRTLYYDSLNSWQESEILGKRRDALYVHRPDGSDVVRPGHEAEERYVTESSTIELSVSQDAANAFVLIVDYSLERFAEEADLDSKDCRKLGVETYGGVKLNDAIYALANHARHLHSWRKDPKNIHAINRDTLKQLGIDPLDDHAACRFLHNVAIPSYLDLEASLIITAHEALAGTGQQLAFTHRGVDAVPISMPPIVPSRT
ncbi:MAG TPA: hypothetical protein VFO29_01595 [Candidatus Rubrimentiphilum sp.]|nr:hypothetical protein [Candidatus Rubrimentiphilum sp.]